MGDKGNGCLVLSPCSPPSAGTARLELYPELARLYGPRGDEYALDGW